MVLAIPTFGGTLSKDPAHPTDLTNPMLNFNDSLKTASAILIHAMNSPEVFEEFGVSENGGATKLTIDDGRTNPDLILNGPFVYIVAESTSRTGCMDVVLGAQKRIRQELIDRQKSFGAPPETYITLDDVVSPTVPQVTRSDKIRLEPLHSCCRSPLEWVPLTPGRQVVIGGQRLTCYPKRGGPRNLQQIACRAAKQRGFKR